MTPDFQQSPESGFCSQCGTANARTAAFCARCGALLPWAAPKAEPVAPQAVEPVAAAAALVPPPMPPMSPAATQASPQSASSNTPDLASGVGAFVSSLKTDASSKTPPELVRRYAWHLVALALLLFVMVRMASTLVTLAALGALVSLVVGLKNPEKFRWVFGDRTSKSTVGWTFGALFFLLVSALPSLDGKQEGAASVAPSPEAASVTSPALVVAPVPTSVPNTKSAAQMRADATKERIAQRAARAQAKAQRDSAEKVAEKKQAERDAAMMARAKAEAAKTKAAKTEADNVNAPNLDAPRLGVPKVDFLGTHAIQASVALQDAGLVVTNEDTFAYRQVSVILNDTGIFGGFTFETPRIAPGERVEIPFGDFVTRKDARRFVPSQYKLKRVLLRCKTDYGIGVGSWPVN